MSFHYGSLKTLSERAVVYLKNKGKSESTSSKYVWIWKQIDKYLYERQITECDKNAIIEFLQQKFGNRRICDLTHYEKSCVSQAFNLIQFKETGEMFETIEHVPKEKAELKGEVSNLMLDYLSFKKSKRLSENTLSNYKWYLYGFQKYLYENGITRCQRISPLAIISWSSQFPSGHLGAKHAALCTVRNFLRFAYDEKKTGADLSLVVPRDNYKQQPKLPSTYTKEEVVKILATADRLTPIGKRNYAILLLIVRLGLRASDVRALTFDNIIWSVNIVRFEQCKTGETVELPLPSDAGNVTKLK